jgi:hypothetical protein
VKQRCINPKTQNKSHLGLVMLLGVKAIVANIVIEHDLQVVNKTSIYICHFQLLLLFQLMIR